MTLQKLNSVGCFIDTETLFTYPMLQDGTCDMSDGTKVHLDDTDDEWFDSLSDDDFGTINNLILQREL
jgi:hypothetical protein